MDTLVISNCGKYIIHIRQMNLEGDKWKNMSTNECYRKQSTAVKKAFLQLKKCKTGKSITIEKNLLKTHKKQFKTRKFKYKRGANKQNRKV